MDKVKVGLLTLQQCILTMAAATTEAVGGAGLDTTVAIVGAMTITEAGLRTTVTTVGAMALVGENLGTITMLVDQISSLQGKRLPTAIAVTLVQTIVGSIVAAGIAQIENKESRVATSTILAMVGVVGMSVTAIISNTYQEEATRAVTAIKKDFGCFSKLSYSDAHQKVKALKAHVHSLMEHLRPHASLRLVNQALRELPQLILAAEQDFKYNTSLRMMIIEQWHTTKKIIKIDGIVSLIVEYSHRAPIQQLEASARHNS